MSVTTDKEINSFKAPSDPTPDAIFGHGFTDVIGDYDWDDTFRMVREATDADVRRVLAKAARNVKR